MINDAPITGYWLKNKFIINKKFEFNSFLLHPQKNKII